MNIYVMTEDQREMTIRVLTIAAYPVETIAALDSCSKIYVGDTGEQTHLISSEECPDREMFENHSMLSVKNASAHN